MKELGQVIWKDLIIVTLLYVGVQEMLDKESEDS